jgi:hypothetical protein
MRRVRETIVLLTSIYARSSIRFLLRQLQTREECDKGTGEGKFVLRIGHEGPEGE